MPLLKDTRTTPPGGWRYTQPETALEMRGNSLPELIGTVTAHRKYKGLERTFDYEVSIDIQRQICAALPGDFAHPETSD